MGKGGSEQRAATSFCRDPRDPGMESFLRVLGMKNNENENPISKISMLLCFLLFFVIDFSFSLCFTMILGGETLKTLSKS